MIRGAGSGCENHDIKNMHNDRSDRTLSGMPLLPKSKLSNGDSTEQKEEYHEILDRVDAARVDGRARNVLYRMKQLHALYSFLLKRKEDLVKAIQKGRNQNFALVDSRFTTNLA